MSRISKHVVIFGDNVAIVTGTKMDPNFIVIEFILPKSAAAVVVHKARLTFTTLTISDVIGFETFDEFKITYPEYFV